MVCTWSLKSWQMYPHNNEVFIGTREFCKFVKVKYLRTNSLSQTWLIWENTKSLKSDKVAHTILFLKLLSSIICKMGRIWLVASREEDDRLLILILVASFIIIGMIVIIGVVSCVLLCFEDDIGSDIEDQVSYFGGWYVLILLLYLLP